MESAHVWPRGRVWGCCFGAPRRAPCPQLSIWARQVAASPGLALRGYSVVPWGGGPALGPGAPTHPLGSLHRWALSRSLPAQRVSLWPALLRAPHQAAGSSPPSQRRGDTPALPQRPASSRASSELDRGGWALGHPCCVLLLRTPFSPRPRPVLGGRARGHRHV